MLKIMWRTGEWDIRGDPLLIDHVCEQVGHKGGPFAKKPWCTSKCNIRGDPLLINHGGPKNTKIITCM